jgi:predicted nucleotidyltransferase
MNARPILDTLARVFDDVGLEVILIGNAAAALQAAPVTTIDFDFLFRKTARNVEKLKSVAELLQGTILRPFYPSSDLFRLVRDEDSLQVDFMTTIHGIKSFASLRARARAVDFSGHSLLVADLADIVRSKRAAGRPRDKAVLDILEKVLDEKTRHEKTKAERPEGGK